MDRVFFNLLLAALPTQLGLHVWPQWSMVLGRRVDYLSPTMYITDILVVLTLAFWRPKTISIPRFALVCIVFAVVNIAFASRPLVSTWSWIKVVEYALLAQYIIHTKPPLARTIFFLSIGAAYSSILALAQVMLQKSVGLWILGERTFTADTPGIARFAYQTLFTLRAYATFPHPNVLGGFLAIVLPLVAFAAKKEHTRYYVSVLITGVMALVATVSRSAWIVALSGFGLMTKKHLLLLTVPLLFVVGTTTGLSDESVIVRNQLGTAAVAQLAASPLVGTGLGNFLVELPNTLVSRQIYFLQPVHNIFLLVLSETGIIGCGLFLFLLFRCTRKKSIARTALYLMLFLGLIDHYPLTLQQGQLMFTILLAESTIGTS